MEKTTLNIRLDSDLKIKLQELANKDSRTLSNYVVKLLKEGVMNK